jgi:hypothetical protein
MSERRIAPAPERNKGPILAVLRRVLPTSGVVLEIASGTGQHIVHFAQSLPDLEWQPSDPDPESRSSTTGWIAYHGLSNVRAPLNLDVAEEVWPVARADAVLCINMIHISPWASTLHLLTGAGRLLPRRGVLFLYGPYRQSGRQTAPSNEAFDVQLQRQNPAWGLRSLESVVESAMHRGFELTEVVEMPANNLSVVFRYGTRNEPAD